MPTRANSSFTIDNRDAEPTPWEGGQMSRTRLTKTFTGDLVGTSVVEAIMLGMEDGGPAVYVGVEQFDCALHGRKGTFLLTHSATMHGADSASSWTVVPGSGTGELAGLDGDAEITPEHDFLLDYTLES
jgi:hypothetical protein